MTQRFANLTAVLQTKEEYNKKCNNKPLTQVEVTQTNTSILESYEMFVSKQHEQANAENALNDSWNSLCVTHANKSMLTAITNTVPIPVLYF